MRDWCAATLVMAAGLAACRGVPVKLVTPQPLEVDVSLRIDIYQHRVSVQGDAETAAPDAEAGTDDEQTRRRARMGEIQTFKNSRLVGENRTGRLSIIELPSGDHGARVEAAVNAENADRTTLMKAEAAARRVPLATVEAEQAQQWRDRAFPGEWVEAQQADGTWRWVQKRADGDPAAAIEPTP